MLVPAMPTGLIVDPVALVDVAVLVDEPALAVGLVESPVALVEGTVRPELAAAAVAERGLPGTGVHCTVWEL